MVEPAAGKREKSATYRQAWLVAASYVDADGSEQPRLQAVGKVPVAAMGSRAPKGAATKNTKITEQSTHQFPSGGRLGGPGVREHMPVKRQQQGDARN